MNYLVISDIHGDRDGLEKALALKDRLGAEKIIELGDVMYHGPRNPVPKAHDPLNVAAQLNAHKTGIIGVRGNCDAEIDQVLLEFPMMGDFQTIRLGDGRKVIITHGHLNEYRMGLLPGSVVLSGHTHVARAEKEANGIYRCNPGSVSCPKAELPASCGLLADDGFTVYAVADGQALLSVKWEDSK